jgi:hypothetical protein
VRFVIAYFIKTLNCRESGPSYLFFFRCMGDVPITGLLFFSIFVSE